MPHSSVSTPKQRVILIHSLYVSYFPSCLLLVGTFGSSTVAQFLWNCSLNARAFSVRSCRHKEEKKNQECAGPKQIFCVECLVILINTRRVLKLSQCPRHLLIIIMRVVTLVYYLCVWAFSLIYFSSFERNENEVKLSLINLKCINTNQN